MIGWMILVIVAISSAFLIFVGVDKFGKLMRAFFKGLKPLFIKDVQVAPKRKKAPTVPVADVGGNRRTISGTLLSSGEQAPQNTSQHDILVLKINDIERRMRRLALDNDIDGLNGLALETSSLFNEIINNKPRTELDNTLVIKVKNLMAEYGGLIQQCERARTMKIDKLGLVGNTNKTYTAPDTIKPGEYAKALNAHAKDTTAEQQPPASAQNYNLYEFSQYLTSKYLS